MFIFINIVHNRAIYAFLRGCFEIDNPLTWVRNLHDQIECKKKLVDWIANKIYQNEENVFSIFDALSISKDKDVKIDQHRINDCNKFW